ncbi:MAG: ABC transporter permease [bacterium]|nr:ABC transporter permease [bacterium]
MKLQWIAWRLVLEIRRDRRTLAMFFLVPLVVMTLIYYALQGDEQADLAVVTRGVARLWDYPIRSTLGQEDNLRLVDLDLDDQENDPLVIEAAIRAALVQGKVQGVLYLNTSLLEERFSGGRGQLHLYLEGSRPTASADILSGIASAMDDLAEQLPVVVDETCSAECAASVNSKALELKKHFLYGNEDYRTIDYFLPAFPPLLVFFFTFIITIITFQRERARGTLARLLIAPFSFAQVVWGYVLGFFVFFSVQSAIVLAYVLVLLEIPVTLSQVVQLGLLTLLLMTVALMMGLFASFLAKNEFQAIQFIPLAILPQIFLSDMIWRIETFPVVFRWIAYSFPLTYANWAARDLILKGIPLWQEGPELAALIGFMLLFLFGMMLFVKQRRAL